MATIAVAVVPQLAAIVVEVVSQEEQVVHKAASFPLLFVVLFFVLKATLVKS